MKRWQERQPSTAWTPWWLTLEAPSLTLSLSLFSYLSLFLFFRYPQPLPRFQLHDTLASLAGNISKVPNPFQENLSQKCLTGTKLIQPYMLLVSRPFQEGLSQECLTDPVSPHKTMLLIKVVCEDVLLANHIKF